MSIDLAQMFGDQPRGSSSPHDPTPRSRRTARGRSRKTGSKEGPRYSGGFRRLIILNETPVDYPDPPYDPAQEEKEMKEIEDARRLYQASKPLKLKGDPFRHRRYLNGNGNLDLVRGVIPPDYRFSLG
jgi:hypothetical protein